MRRLHRVLLLAATVTLLGCSSSDPAGTPPTTDARSSVTTVPAGGLPDWQQVVPTVGGAEIDLADFAGETVLFWFWAPY